MNVKDFAAVVEQITPLGLAQPWDNVGLLLGNPRQNVRNVLLTIDVTQAVVAEAKELKTDLILSYHPVIWDGLKKIRTDDASKTVHELIRAGISVFSIHTALDAVGGGVNDGLAEMVGIQDPKPIGDYIQYSPQEFYKFVVFVPVDALAGVANAIFEAGAGWIGNYSHCGFNAEGTGTFLPLEGARPAIGRRGRLEEVQEARLETIVPADKVQAVVEAMKRAHPYEVPAFDIYKLFDYASRFGLGRIGTLAEPTRLDRIIAAVKRRTGARAVGLVGDPKRLVRKAAVCAGTCGAILNLIIAAGADLYLTGELKHHQALAAQEAGLTCVCLSHTVSERFILKKLAGQIRTLAKGVAIKVSRKDADPFTWKNV
ncbi:MAG: Nif3-like dinuclear metal center hexameric protein [Planctomycetes bacterium]|jgi:dinuclear metal center YbgI/SA1388 family protein|nr:Nif3-like dinuclear metal center hexameric protein [Planctomycetota bacterium]